MKELNNKIVNSVIILVLILGAFWIGTSVGNGNSGTAESIRELDNKEQGMPENTDFSTFWKAWNVINEKYVGNDDVLTQDKVWGAISGLANSLDDPYTTFLPPQEAELFAENIKGNFGGVGMEVGIRDDTLTIIAPLKGTPAERGGVLSGDKILAVDGTPTTRMGIDEAVSLIRGEVGTEVVLTLFRKGVDGTFDIAITRDIIKIPTMETELLPSGVFVIRLFNFSAISTNEFRTALRNFLQSESNNLILDLRGNPGGFLAASVDMASWFLPAGKVVVTEDYGKNGEPIIHRSKGYNIFTDNLNFVILLNQGSASASEILAGALKDHGKAVIVGAQSFGKGSVQELVSITDKTSLKVTVARWLTPAGNSISENGITPDFEVEMTREDFEAERDPQQDKAVEILLGG